MSWNLFLGVLKLSFWDIFVQLIDIFGTILYLLSYQCKKAKNLFTVQLFSYLCYMLHLLLLGAYTGCFSYIVNMLRCLFLAGKWEFVKTKKMCLILCFLQVGIVSLTWNGILSLLPVIANITATIAGYTKNPQKYRLAGILVNSPLWIIYDFFVGSWAGILDEAISEVSMVSSFFKNRKTENKNSLES